jgi:uncharacterized membrane protein AbrB (regulator of aidB expression)
MILRLLLTFLVAVLCGFILLKLKVPGGMLVGAIIGVVTLNISTGLAYMPYAGKSQRRPPQARLSAVWWKRVTSCA